MRIKVRFTKNGVKRILVLDGELSVDFIQKLQVKYDDFNVIEYIHEEVR